MSTIHLGGKSDIDHFKSIDDQIIVLRVRRDRIRNEMQSLETIMRHAQNITITMMNEYQKLNEELRTVKITEAEIVFIRNQL